MTSSTSKVSSSDSVDIVEEEPSWMSMKEDISALAHLSLPIVLTYLLEMLPGMHCHLKTKIV
jgi:hypothetical protein